MAEAGVVVGESSNSNELWAKLVPSDSRYSDVEIKSDEFVVCSVITPTPTPSSSSAEFEWCKIIRNSDFSSATLYNQSSNTILADETLIQNEDSVVIKCGSEIIPGPIREGYLSYRFKLMPRPETNLKQLKICIDVDHAKCSICLSIWHNVVTIAPCFHNFCNGCFSEWLRRSQEKHSNILCPQCRAVVQFAGRNHFLQNIGEDILQADSSLKRSNDEVAVLDSYSSIQSNLIIKSERKFRRKRAHSPVDEDSHGVDLPCPQCGTEFGGFRCNNNTVHLQCQACGGMMPSRINTTVAQHCLGCDKAFCGAYWHAQRVTGIGAHAICSHETFKPISERTISRIPFWAHEKNRHEQDITEKCIRQMGRTLQDVVAEWITKLDNREIDRTGMPLDHAEMITAQTHLCNDCYEKLVSFLLYCYRISTPKHLLPSDALAREDCWYGYGCRTQHHNEAHARKRNHVCRPTRGSNA
ncbi:43kDa postsynaptic protein [Parasponia andersonii]|uniref:43kDa postsynaptic protein n=1 Tax=Parasponia andersonii TaxID=3476 RepID=A0A2P5AGE3_PARAD|nr:43kDa postsynaptic protein [Parasponia andersonii]